MLGGVPERATLPEETMLSWETSTEFVRLRRKFDDDEDVEELDVLDEDEDEEEDELDELDDDDDLEDEDDEWESEYEEYEEEDEDFVPRRRGRERENDWD